MSFLVYFLNLLSDSNIKTMQMLIQHHPTAMAHVSLAKCTCLPNLIKFSGEVFVFPHTETGIRWNLETIPKSWWQQLGVIFNSFSFLLSLSLSLSLSCSHCPNVKTLPLAEWGVFWKFSDANGSLLVRFPSFCTFYLFIHFLIFHIQKFSEQSSSTSSLPMYIFL